MITHHDALVYCMVLMSAADNDMTDSELRIIGDIVNSLPVFADYDTERLTVTASQCADLLVDEDGLDRALDMVYAALPERLRETAYALALDVAAADGAVHPEEMRMLELIRHRLEIDRLIAAALERGARAHFATL
ncbi:tellurite resistance TerB family protein [Magnetospira thiophila]